MADLFLKPSNTMDCSEWREVIRVNWRDSNGDSDDMGCM